MPSYEEFMQLDERRGRPRPGGRSGGRGATDGLRDAAIVRGAGELLGWGADKALGFAKNELDTFGKIMNRRADNKHAGSEASSGKSHKKVS